VPGSELIFFPRLACADQVTQGFVSFVRNPDSGQIAGSVTACQFLGVTAVRLHPIPGLDGNQPRGHNLAIHAQRGELPVKHISGRARFVAGPQLLCRPQLADHFPDRFKAVRDRPDGSDFSARLGYCYGNRLSMDIQSDKA
jgi:hypothetical protein